MELKEIGYASVNDTRDVHHVRVHGNEPGVIYLNHLSWFANDQYLIENYDYCEDEQFVDVLRTHTILRNK